jgi:hypothetical protein
LLAHGLLHLSLWVVAIEIIVIFSVSYNRVGRKSEEVLRLSVRLVFTEVVRLFVVIVSSIVKLRSSSFISSHFWETPASFAEIYLSPFPQVQQDTRFIWIKSAASALPGLKTSCPRRNFL